jgi:hypothetical protein
MKAREPTGHCLPNFSFWDLPPKASERLSKLPILLVIFTLTKDYYGYQSQLRSWEKPFILNVLPEAAVDRRTKELSDAQLLQSTALRQQS